MNKGVVNVVTPCVRAIENLVHDRDLVAEIFGKCVRSCRRDNHSDMQNRNRGEDEEHPDPRDTHRFLLPRRPLPPAHLEERGKTRSSRRAKGQHHRHRETQQPKIDTAEQPRIIENAIN